MQVLVHITSHSETITPIMEKMMEKGIHGATVVECEGMLGAVNQDSINVPVMFGGLRQFINPERPENKLILVALKEEQLDTAISIIHEVSGNLNLPNTGVLFTLSMLYSEGLEA